MVASTVRLGPMNRHGLWLDSWLMVIGGYIKKMEKGKEK